MTRPRGPREPTLFDLPLQRPAGHDRAPEPRRSPPVSEPGRLPFAPAAEEPIPAVEEKRPALPRPTLRQRWLAGLLDAGAGAATLVIVLVGLSLLGVDLERADIPALAVFLLAFSFLYHTLPLAFWGHTPGMAAYDLVARSRSGEGLTFRQVIWRWVGLVLTFLLAGLPSLLALVGGRSLADRMSDSVTRVAEPRDDPSDDRL